MKLPTRRLAGVALLLARSDERGRLPLEALLDRIRAGRAALQGAAMGRKLHPLLKELADWFVTPGEGMFWGLHYSFHGAAAARTMTLNRRRRGAEPGL